MLHVLVDSTMPVVPVEGASFDLLLQWRSSAQTPRRPLNLSLVLDRSGSMAGQPLRQALVAASRVVRALGPQDTLSIVAYDDAVEVVMPPLRVTDPGAIEALLGRIHARGLTNLSGGWQRGIELLAEYAAPGTLSRVLLLTDGQANVGITDGGLLARSAAGVAAQGYHTTTLGFGHHFNEELLIEMARAGRGNFYFIQSPDDAADVFAIELDSLRALAAQQMTVRVAPRAGVALAPLGSLPATQDAAGAWEIALGDVYEGEGRPLALHVALPAGDAGEEPIATIHFRYQHVVGEEPLWEEAEATVRVRRGTLAEAMAAPPAADVVQRVALLRIADAKEQALRLADGGQWAEAGALLRATAEQMEAQGLAETFAIAEELAQLEYFAEVLARRQLRGADRKELRDQAYQGQTRGREDLQRRGTGGGSVAALPRVDETNGGVELRCVREGGKLRVRACSEGYDPSLNIQFPRAIRVEGAHYVVEGLALSQDGSFYRPVGTTYLLARPGDEHLWQQRTSYRGTPRAARASLTLADLEESDEVGGGVLVQCVRAGSKLRVRVVSDGYDPDLNVRFPRAIRQEGLLFVVEAITPTSAGTSYIARGTIRRFVQPGTAGGQKAA